MRLQARDTRPEHLSPFVICHWSWPPSLCLISHPPSQTVCSSNYSSGNILVAGGPGAGETLLTAREKSCYASQPCQSHHHGSLAPGHRGKTIVRRSKYQNKGHQYNSHNSYNGAQWVVNNYWGSWKLNYGATVSVTLVTLVTLHCHGLLTRIWGVNGV